MISGASSVAEAFDLGAGIWSAYASYQLQNWSKCLSQNAGIDKIRLIWDLKQNRFELGV